MKVFLVFIFLLCIAGSQAFENHGIGHTSSSGEYHEHHNHDARAHYKEDVHHDYLDDDHDFYHHDYIVKPCPLNDIKCIHNFFKNNSMCQTHSHPTGHPYIIKKSTMDVPHANFTFTINNAELRGLESGKIKEFYFNKKTDTLVFEVEFETLIVDSPKSVATYYRKGREPFEVADFSFIDFRNTSLTLIIRHLHDAKHFNSHVYAYFNHYNFPVKVGPHFGDSRALTKMKKKWLGYLGLSAVEAMTAQAPVYMSAYLQSQICSYRYH